MPSEQARLTIVFDLQADPVAGVICDDTGGPDAPFAGWMELTRVIERALDAARRSHRGPAGHSGSLRGLGAS